MVQPFLSSSWYRVEALRPKLRAHSQVHRHRYRGAAWYVLQDHASGKAHRFTPAAYFFIASLDGVRTVDEISHDLSEQLGEQAPTQDEIIQLLAQLHAADLIQSDARPDAADLIERFSRQRRSTLSRSLRNPLSMTIPLWDPDRFLQSTLFLLQPFRGVLGSLLWLSVVVPATLIAGLYWGELSSDFSDRVLTAQGLAILALVYPFVKLAHELAHAYTTKAMGGEVHELGIMFIVFYPVPYVDASSAAVFSSKWQRVLVGAAGMAAEVFLAALAFYLWLTVEPGVIRACAYDMILIAGVSTLIVNGNPLLRFDGYYILSDLLEIPNLASRSTRYWAEAFDRRLFGAEPRDLHLSEGERKWLFLYGPVSFAYRLFVLFGIAIIIASKFVVVGALVAIWALIATIALPLMRGAQYLVRVRHARTRRLVTSTVVTGALIAFFLVVPLPHHTMTEGVIWLPESAHIRAGADGFLHSIAENSGAEVVLGEQLFESVDPLLQMEIDVDRHKVEELNLKLAAQQFVDRVAAQLARGELEQEQAKLQSDLSRAHRLIARSEYSGVLVIPKAQDLPGRFFREGDLLGYVAPSRADTVRVLVSQADIDLVRNQVRAIEVKLPGRFEQSYSASIIREVPTANDQLPSKALSVAGGGQATADPRDETGSKSLQRWFQFDLKLDRAPDVGFGSRVYVRFEHNWESLWGQVSRRARQLFLARFYA
jgi:putative peptide zinc metalloprotease protein